MTTKVLVPSWMQVIKRLYLQKVRLLYQLSSLPGLIYVNPVKKGTDFLDSQGATASTEEIAEMQDQIQAAVAPSMPSDFSLLNLD